MDSTSASLTGGVSSDIRKRQAGEDAHEDPCSYEIGEQPPRCPQQVIGDVPEGVTRLLQVQRAGTLKTRDDVESSGGVEQSEEDCQAPQRYAHDAQHALWGCETLNHRQQSDHPHR